MKVHYSNKFISVPIIPFIKTLSMISRLAISREDKTHHLVMFIIKKAPAVTGAEYDLNHENLKHNDTQR